VIPLADLLDVQQNLPVEPLPSATQTDYPNIPDGELLEYCHRATQIESGTNSKADLPEVRQEKSLEDKYNFPSVSKFP